MMNKTYETIVSQRNLGLAIQQMRHLIESRQLTQFATNSTPPSYANCSACARRSSSP